jgi:RNA polymerase sigma-70 factor, ECF subfamily
MRQLSPTPMTSITTAADAQLAALTRLVDGDNVALDLIYQAHSGPVYRYLLALCGDASVAADAMHDAFVALIDRPTGFDPARGTLGGYLAGIARRTLWARWRDPLHQAIPLDGSDQTYDEPVTDTADDPLQQLVTSQDCSGLMVALLALPWVFREALVLVDLQERDYREAAAIAGIPLNTLRTRVLRGRRRLAQALGAKSMKEQTT